MKQVAKVVIIDSKGYHLLMTRANHPTFRDDPDLPGGTIEPGEAPLEAALREVAEEINVSLDTTVIHHIYTGTEYSRHGTEYSLYVARVVERPSLVISWEHGSYAWVDRDTFLAQARAANDTYMHMVHDVVSSNQLP
jgi:8-oxo-dGTP pyrophosphatase MutT (NUDIX family)